MRVNSIDQIWENHTALDDSTKIASGHFHEMLVDFLADVNNDLHASNKAQEALLNGQVDNMIELMTTIQKADITLRFTTELRNKVIEAYQEIMRMQI